MDYVMCPVQVWCQNTQPFVKSGILGHGIGREVFMAKGVKSSWQKAWSLQGRGREVFIIHGLGRKVSMALGRGCDLHVRWRDLHGRGCDLHGREREVWGRICVLKLGFLHIRESVSEAIALWVQSSELLFREIVNTFIALGLCEL